MPDLGQSGGSSEPTAVRRDDWGCAHPDDLEQVVMRFLNPEAVGSWWVHYTALKGGPMDPHAVGGV